MKWIHRRVMLLILAGGLAAGPSGCGTTKAATPAASEGKKPVEKAGPGESMDGNLAREGEKWMVEQAKKRAADAGGPAPVAKQGAVPATAR